MYDLDEILNWELTIYFGECSYEGGGVNDLKIVIKRILVIRVCDVLEERWKHHWIGSLSESGQGPSGGWLTLRQRNELLIYFISRFNTFNFFLM